MKAKCISRELTEEQRLLFKVPALFRSIYQISIGREYLVLGIWFAISSPAYGTLALLEIVNDAGRYRSIPAALFEIVDSRCSSLWEARFHESGAVTMWPSEFYRTYFHDDLSNGDPQARKIFESVLAKMKSEF